MDLNQSATLPTPFSTVADQLKHAQDTFSNIVSSVNTKEKLIVDLEKHDKFSLSVARWYSKILILIVYFFSFIIFCAICDGMDTAWWINIIMGIFYFGLIENILILPLVKGKIKKQVGLLNKPLIEAKQKYYYLVDTILMPEIHALGAVNIDDVLNKTSGNKLAAGSIASILNAKADDGVLEKIELQPNAYLYKSTQPPADGGSNIETFNF